MTDIPEKTGQDILISFADLKRVVKKNKRKIYLGILVFALLGFFYALFRPIQYEAHASFREKGKSRSGMGSGLGAAVLFMGDGAIDSDALTMMTSRKLLEEVVKSQGLQGYITKDEFEFPFLPLARIKNNLLAEYVSFKKPLTLVVRPPIADLKTEQVFYAGEVPTHLILSVTAPEQYTLLDITGKNIGHGTFGIPFSTDKFAFTLVRRNPKDLTGSAYTLSLLPLEFTANTLKSQLTFLPDKNDKSLLRISHRNSDRNQAAKNLNMLMTAYLDHIQSEHENLSQMQIDYLRERQEDAGSQLESMMLANAEKLSADLSATGFATSDNAMTFLASTQQQLKQKLFTLDMEIQYLEKIQQEGHLNSELVSDTYDFSAINNITAEKQKLTQQSNSLYLALKNTQNEESPIFNGKDVDASKQGLDLNVAKEIYVAYVKEQSDLESKARQHSFVINQMSESGFEITSLCTILTDPVSMEMIGRTNSLLLSLKDHDNRSSKEQERLLADLTIQKEALKMHIQQSAILLHLRQNFVKEKIIQLQKVLLSLIQEQMSILDQQLLDSISNAVQNLKQGKALLEENLLELRTEMASFPKQRAAEQLITQQMKINQALVEEVSKIVESKNIANNLEKFQSAPVDVAIAPIHPSPPRLLLFTIVGSIAGAFLSCCWVLAWSVIVGVEASPENLRHAGFQVAGMLSEMRRKNEGDILLLDSDLDALRRLIAYITSAPADQKEERGQALVLVEGNGPDYAVPLAELMFKMGLKVLVVDVRFDDYSGSSVPGMLQYLEGKVPAPSVIHKDQYSYIGSGGVCRYSNELLCSRQFKTMLSGMVENYDWVIVSSSALPQSAEAASLLEQIPCASITVSGQSVNDLKTCLSYAGTPGHTIAFMFVS
ncbi:MAG: Wzz/FepE/Etk N-terminal domain-containing protein [Parachlamydiaceae bacterium]